MSVTLDQIEQATATDLLTTELNSLANNTTCSPGAAINNVQATSNFNSYTRAKLQFLLKSAITPTAGSALYVWFLKSLDGGSTYEDGSSSITPARQPDAIIPVRAAAGDQYVTVECNLPVGYFKPIAKNVGMGGSMASSANKLTVLPNTPQGV